MLSFLSACIHCMYVPLLSGCHGFSYKGYCLMSVQGSAYSQPSVSGCQVITPRLFWGYSDYLAICNHFAIGSTRCSNVDFDRDGGRCSNSQALLAFENNISPDVWVSSSRFTWSPTHFSSSQTCQLLSDFGTVVYMCAVCSCLLYHVASWNICPSVYSSVSLSVYFIDP